MKAADVVSVSRLALLHRDLYLDQSPAEDDWIVLLDLDMACMGSIELDIGNYVVHLLTYALRALCVEEHCRAAAHLFVQQY